MEGSFSGRSQRGCSFAQTRAQKSQICQRGAALGLPLTWKGFHCPFEDAQKATSEHALASLVSMGGWGAAENVLILLCGKDLSTSSPQIVYFSSARQLRSPSASFSQHISPLYVSPMLLDPGLGCFTVTQNVAGRYRTSEKTLVAWISFCYVLKPNPSLKLPVWELFPRCFMMWEMVLVRLTSSSTISQTKWLEPNLNKLASVPPLFSVWGNRLKVAHANCSFWYWNLVLSKFYPSSSSAAASHHSKLKQDLLCLIKMCICLYTAGLCAS